jgi:hypothetical protein
MPLLVFLVLMNHPIRGDALRREVLIIITGKKTGK